MDPLTIALLAPTIGGLAGNLLSQGDADRSGDAYRQALAQFAGIELPKVSDMEVFLEQLQNAGNYNPVLEQAIGLGPSAMEGLALNPEMRAKQMEALKIFADRALTGMTPEDKMGMDLAFTGALGSGRANEGRILQEMQSRGMGGSGAELIARLNNSQNATEAARRQGVEQALASQQAKMNAAGGYLSGAGQLRSQDFGEQSQVAQAKDLISRYNNSMSNAAQQRNVASQNQYGFAGLQNQQNIMNQNTALRNQQQMYNKNLLQQNFNNQMAKAGGTAGQYQNMGNYYGQQAANTAGMWSGLGKGAGEAYVGYNQMQNANKLADSQANYWNSMAQNKIALPPVNRPQSFLMNQGLDEDGNPIV